MKPTIILIDTAFPYEKVEPFLETEIQFYNNKANVYIANCILQNKAECRDTGSAVVLDMPQIEAKGIRYLKKAFWSLKVLTMPQFWNDLKYLKRKKKLDFRKATILMLFMADGEKTVSKLKKELEKLHLNNKLIFYSYWMHVHAYVAARMKELYPYSQFVTRCHRYDLYEERNTLSYLPLRSYILDAADKIMSISEDGQTYVKDRYQCPAEKVSVSRLGTTDHGIGKSPDRKVLEIVSCSWVVKVKRVDKILEALSQIEDIPIRWTHLGGGALFDELEKNAENVPDNITVRLLGNVSNKEVHKLYKEEGFHVFLNVSESEGIPVSIMEAMSYGIPIIATDVGGVKEIVKSNCNILLDKDFKTDDLVSSIKRFRKMSDEEYLRSRRKVRKLWEEQCNAETVYSAFIDQMCYL